MQKRVYKVPCTKNAFPLSSCTAPSVLLALAFSDPSCVSNPSILLGAVLTILRAVGARGDGGVLRGLGTGNRAEASVALIEDLTGC